jgi:cytochrome c oxidase subunit 2
MRMLPLALLAALCLSGCASWQSPLDPHSTEAGHLSDLFWFFATVCAAIWLLVTGAVVYLRLRGTRGSDAPEEDSQARTQRKSLIVGGLVALTVAILTIFALASFYATRGFAWTDEHALTIKVTGNQWWWQVEYQNRDPSQVFRTANEIRIPVGRPVTLELESTDVIHSFWVPDLMGKQDLIPGRHNTLTIKADRAGLYRGQCAEYCGLQHAHMSFFLFAEPNAVFEAWRHDQLRSATPPHTPLQAQGLRLFLGGPCAGCHTVSGTPAGGDLGPDLTHFGSRATIAAGLLHNTPANLAQWLAGPQVLKPGNYMPQIPMSSPDRAALVAYLEGLK